MSLGGYVFEVFLKQDIHPYGKQGVGLTWCNLPHPLLIHALILQNLFKTLRIESSEFRQVPLEKMNFTCLEPWSCLIPSLYTTLQVRAVFSGDSQTWKTT